MKENYPRSEQVQICSGMFIRQIQLIQNVKFKIEKLEYRVQVNFSFEGGLITRIESTFTNLSKRL